MYGCCYSGDAAGGGSKPWIRNRTFGSRSGRRIHSMMHIQTENAFWGRWVASMRDQVRASALTNRALKCAKRLVNLSNSGHSIASFMRKLRSSPRGDLLADIVQFESWHVRGGLFSSPAFVEVCGEIDCIPVTSYAVTRAVKITATSVFGVINFLAKKRSVECWCTDLELWVLHCSCR